jgi:hypothetical protein
LTKRTAWGFGLLVAAFLPVLSCTSSRLTASWADPSYTARPVRSLMVIGISQDQTLRRLYEDTFVSRLGAVNVKAIAGYTLLPDSADADPEALRAAVARSAVETVLITHLVSEEQKTEYTPPTRRYAPPDYYRGMYGYYGAAYNDVYTPGYYTTYTVVKLQSNIYDAETEKLIWSAQSETIESDDVKPEIDALVALLIEDLRKKDLLPAS